MPAPLEPGAAVRCRLRITSELPSHLGAIPFAPAIDFGALARQAGVPGVFEPGSVEVIDLADGAPVEFGRTEDFAYGDRGRIEWPIEDPRHTEYGIRFRTAPSRALLEPQARVPLVGTGDLLRYNAGALRPITLYAMHLVDLTGAGRMDLAGTWNYYHRPGSPISGVVCYPRLPGDGARFGDLVRLRYRPAAGSSEPVDVPGTYLDACFADVDGDGRTDLVFTERGSGRVSFCLDRGERTPAGLPVFVEALQVAAPALDLGHLCLVDLDGDGRLDLVVEGRFVRNANPSGWPFEPAEPMDLGAGPRLAFVDLDGDGRLDLVELADPDGVATHPGESVSQVGYAARWRRRRPGALVAFGDPRPFPDLPPACNRVAAAQDRGVAGLLVQSDALQQVHFYELAVADPETPRLAPRWRAESIGAVLALSDQAWPCACDWDEDGQWDLLVGGGYGWPRLVRNRGSSRRPRLSEAEPILSEGRPIRLLRDEILHSRHWHNMGYPYPVFVDWDGDGLPDLMLPNETNRIVWYRNVGTRGQPRFGPRQYLEVDGFPDSEEARAATGRLAADPARPNAPYPEDPGSPFFWRTGAAFADWNGDGLMDFITHSFDRQATLFVQYRDREGRLRLRRQGPVRLTDGRLIDDSIVGRPMHWTESFRPIDWDGDGRVDLIYSLAGTGRVYLLRNEGTGREPVFAPPREMRCYGEPLAFTVHGPNVWPADLNGDGRPDLLGCVEWSVYPFFAHAALEMESHPRFAIDQVRGETIGAPPVAEDADG